MDERMEVSSLQTRVEIEAPPCLYVTVLLTLYPPGLLLCARPSSGRVGITRGSLTAERLRSAAP